MSILFDPRDARCKSPFGAVTTFAAVDFTFYPCGHAVTGCTLLAHHEFSDRWTETELLPTTDEDGAPAFSGTFFAPSQPELIWYHFRLRWADGGESCYGKDGFQSWDKVTPWQLTVYDGRAKTPGWFGRGVTYQIFPDRFYRKKARGVDGLIGCRTLHERWDETPLCGPNERGDYCEDFFGGDLAGITEKLDYLASLHVTTLYLNPIFESASNHRYDTGDYRKVDPILGTNTDFKKLCAAAADCGIRIVLDGVFAHTGADSRYFNRFRHYPGCGAYNSRSSVYARWYSFAHYPDDYKCWWDFKDLPAVNAANPDWRKYMITGERSIVKTWLRDGASGWRLDVADELPDDVLRGMRSAAKETDPDSVLLGEVWEDAVTKVSYGERRQYALGDALDSVMNYPFRTALLSYLAGTSGAEDFRDAMETIRENYPSPAFYGAMNFLSTHDTPRLLTLLGCEQPPADRDARAHYRLSPAERERGTALLKLAALVLYAFPGSPTVYYGDEAGMQGLCDPFNRAPLQMCDTQMLQWYAQLTALRHAHPALTRGEVAVFAPAGDVLCVLRVIAGTRDAFGEEAEDEALLLIVNRAAHPVRCHVELTCPGAGLCEETRLAFVRSEYDCAADCTDDTHIAIHDGVGAFDLPPYAAKIYRLENRHGTETGS